MNNSKPMLRHIINTNFNITACYIFRQLRRGTWETFSTIGSPRRLHGFVFLLNCDCTYVFPNGTKKYAHMGDVVYLPPFCEYTSYFHNFSNGNYNADNILIDMNFSDENNNVFYLSDGLKIFNISDSDKIKKLFLSISEAYEQPIKKLAEIKSIAYSLLSYLGTHDKIRKINLGKYNIISKGIYYLENDITQHLSIEDIAAMCNVSSVYFRKLFKEYSGLSPIQFRLHKKIEIAKELLVDDDMSINTLSSHLGFENVTYFSRAFKKIVGVSPQKFKTEYYKN